MAKFLSRFSLFFNILIISSLFSLAFSSVSLGAELPVKLKGLKVSKVKLSQDHKSIPLGYNTSKEIPMGGVHNPVWASCGIYNTEIAPEYAIHSMEHGAVWIAYDMKLPAKDLEKLKKLAGNDPYILLSPVKNAPSKITFTAWGYQIESKSSDDARFSIFLDNFKNKKGITPEFGAPCLKGLSDPKLLAKAQKLV